MVPEGRATATYAPFEVVGWAPTDQTDPYWLVLLDVGIPDALAQLNLCLN